MARAKGGRYLVHDPIVGALAIYLSYACIADGEVSVAARHADGLSRVGLVNLAIQGKPTVGDLNDFVRRHESDDESHTSILLPEEPCGAPDGGTTPPEAPGA